MDVYLLRASLPNEDGPNGFLSAEGRRLVRAVGTKLKNATPTDFPEDIGRVLVAPHLASVQTAELFAERIDFIGVIEVLPALAAGVPAQVAGGHLVGLATAASRTLVVADEPALSALGAWLVGRPTFPPLRHAQVSAILDRRPAWYQRADTGERLPLLVA